MAADAFSGLSLPARRPERKGNALAAASDAVIADLSEEPGLRASCAWG